MYRLFLIFSLLFIVINKIKAQDNHLVKYWKEKNAISDLKDYYLKEYNQDTNNIDLLKQLAYYEYKSHDTKNGIIHYDKIIKNNKSLTTDIFITYGKCLKNIEKYFEAKEIFKEGLKLAKKTKNRDYITLFNREIESTDWAIKNINQNNNYHETSISKLQNEYSVFNSNWLEKSIFLTYITKQPYKISTDLFNPITNSIQKLKHEFQDKIISNITVFETDKVYFSICDSINKCKIGIGKIKNDSIINIRELKGINYENKSTYTMPYFFKFENKNYLLYCSNNSKSIGGLDIFYGELIKDDSLNSGINIVNINTPYDDVSPFYDELDFTLYFSNSWMNGFGGLDIFATKFYNLKTSTIKNLGKPFNSGYNDLYFNIKDSIYTLTSNRLEKYNCCNYYFHYSKNKNTEEKNIEFTSPIESYNNVDKTISNQKKELSEIKNLKNLFPIVLYFHNDIPNPKSIDSNTNIEYDVTYNEYIKLKNEYLRNNKNINSNQEIENFFTKNIPDEFEKLNQLLKIISEENDTTLHFKIIIKGFASPLASNTYNLRLSKRRIKSIINYMKKFNNGIISDKIGTKITFEYTPLGEEKASKKINDNPKNKNKSIYSIDAAKERKIELIGIDIHK